MADRMRFIKGTQRLGNRGAGSSGHTRALVEPRITELDAELDAWPGCAAVPVLPRAAVRERVDNEETSYHCPKCQS